MSTIFLASNQQAETKEPNDYVDRSAAKVELDFHFEYDNEIHTPLPLITEYVGSVPQRHEIIVFSVTDGIMLTLAGLPTEVWQVNRVTYDFADGSLMRVSVGLYNALSANQCGDYLIH